MRRVTSRAAQDAEDAQQSAVTVALELRLERGALDFGRAEHVETFWTRLAREWRRLRAGSHSRSVDAPIAQGDANALALVDLLQAEQTSDPLERLLELQSRAEGKAMLLLAKRRTYSQFAAYVITLERFDFDGARLAAYLAIARATLSARVLRSWRIVQAQRSLFDGLIVIGADFHPRRGAPRSPPPVHSEARVEPQLPMPI